MHKNIGKTILNLNSEVLDEYENVYDMKTGKLIIHETATNRNRYDEKSYIPFSFHKNNGQLSGKISPEDRDSKRLRNYL